MEGIAKYYGSLSIFELLVASQPSVQAALLDGQGQKPTPNNLKKQCDSLAKKIESQCAGLIEFNQKSSWRTLICEPSEWDLLVPSSELVAGFIHRTASDFLTETQDGERILEGDATSQADRLISLLRGSMSQYALWPPRHPDDKDYVQYDEFRFSAIMSAIRRSSLDISERATDSLMRPCEAIWDARVPIFQVHVPGAHTPTS